MSYCNENDKVIEENISPLEIVIDGKIFYVMRGQLVIAATKTQIVLQDYQTKKISVYETI